MRNAYYGIYIKSEDVTRVFLSTRPEHKKIIEEFISISKTDSNVIVRELSGEVAKFLKLYSQKDAFIFKNDILNTKLQEEKTTEPDGAEPETKEKKKKAKKIE